MMEGVAMGELEADLRRLNAIIKSTTPKPVTLVDDDGSTSFMLRDICVIERFQGERTKAKIHLKNGLPIYLSSQQTEQLERILVETDSEWKL